MICSCGADDDAGGTGDDDDDDDDDDSSAGKGDDQIDVKYCTYMLYKSDNIYW